ncbi:MAG: diaminopimelate decarboxylase [Alphaproteobacteria bacterium]|nr:diaminopimelate decarboxylase [Alphaproteobacteria bacterium]
MDTTALARTYPTPFYAYDAAVLRARIGDLTEAFKAQNVSLHYAVKANDNPAIIAMAAKAGIGACLVSAGEMKRAMAGGMPPALMLMNGVGKSDADIRFALANGIGQLNVESIPELTVIADIAREMGVVAPIGLRINPEVAANTHSNIATGRRTDKFGLLAEDLPEAKRIIAARPELKWIALSCHIGSQVHDVNDLRRGYAVMADIFRAQEGLDRLDLGGGFGVSYRGDAYSRPADFAPVVAELTKDLQARGVRIQLEPGRYIAAEAGTLVTSVIHVKDSGGMRFIVVDAAMNDLIRPALYEAYHPIRLGRSSKAATMPCTIVGPVCESSDCFARDRGLPADIVRGDVLEIGFAGAYGFTMSGQYNARPRLAEVLIDGNEAKLIRRAFTAEDFDAATLAA